MKITSDGEISKEGLAENDNRWRDQLGSSQIFPHLVQEKDSNISSALVLRSLPLIAAIFPGDFYNYYYGHLKVTFLESPSLSLCVQIPLIQLKFEWDC